MDFHLIRMDQLITIFHIYQLKGPIMPVLASKEQHKLKMMISRLYRIHLSKFRMLLLTKCNIILDH
jgi:hypothetical protein